MNTYKAGDVVQRWHDSGALGSQPVFGEVVRVNRKTVTVRWESGLTWRIEPHHLQPVIGKFADEIRSEYLKKEK